MFQPFRALFGILAFLLLEVRNLVTDFVKGFFFGFDFAIHMLQKQRRRVSTPLGTSTVWAQRDNVVHAQETDLNVGVRLKLLLLGFTERCDEFVQVSNAMFHLAMTPSNVQVHRGPIAAAAQGPHAAQSK
jgi:hypothetical protein